MSKRNLILIHRGPEYEKDFKEIARKVTAIDRDITVYALASSSMAQLPSLAWMWPTLVVALTPEFRLQVRRGTVLKNTQVEKLAQNEIFRKAGIPAPPMLPFRFGMTLDPLLFGEFVLIKPMDLDLTSRGLGIQLFRRHRLERMEPRDFPPDHPIHEAREGYLVQKFIDTGRHPGYYRIQTFFGRIIYSWHSSLKTPRCDLTAPDSEIERTVIATQGRPKHRQLVKDADIRRLAERVHGQFPDHPILGCDLIRDAATRELHVLECNPGGNTWHFSSKGGENLRLEFGNAPANGIRRAHQLARRMLMEQYGAFDIVAKALAEKTATLAA
ncbi:MAG: hypothetical protein AB7S92_06405 [Parvibaculaceae bacterium]